ncbi:phosphatidylinositol-3-phosphatase SAC1-like isoform X2 [Xenia sp. Carnegie-2017]|uniref:phosphatidylinositol-3-phosphatase SAC1-like isoform X2 n=1 Tax=Xenia sp. Carnegie-2017 TaxID=2897299 RepID=UPI001F04AEDF|nr:phosphatidylinositol-3-phosphatase SAC1-like isoform X2 [Xenia sp. Carnegie-2017]
MAALSVYNLLRLYVSADKFYVEPKDSKETDEKVLEIDRVSQELVLADNKGQIPVQSESKDIFGIIGVINLIAGSYLVVITKRKFVGIINSHEIWKVQATEVIAFPRTQHHLSEKQDTDNKTYLLMIEQVLLTDGFYFSTTYDLTHTLQRLSKTSPDFLHMPLHERADQRFLWNGHFLRMFAVQPELSRFILPVIHGFIEFQNCSIKSRTFDFILISRRSCYRAGVRYYIRGLDVEGHPANYVETEQIIQYNGETTSFVQIRGSIPLYWSQRPTLQYKPRPKLLEADHNTGFQQHMEHLIYHYNEIVLVDLIDHKGPEKEIGDQLTAVVTASPYSGKQLRLERFDFHKECSKLRWHRLSILMSRLKEDQEKFGYFKMMRDKTVTSEQAGVFRTNCMDCLDRTNVVQSMLARASLQTQFEHYGILLNGEKVQDCSSFEYIYKNAWADNADACSNQYAGTGALKTDFTRTGKRTRWGLLQDGYNSIIRYYKNNFSDGFRQDAIDLFLGNYVVDSAEGITKPSPLQKTQDWKFMLLPFILLIGFSMLIMSAMISTTDPGFQFMYVLFWGLAVVFTLSIIFYYGKEFVDEPKLVHKPIKDKNV